MNNQEVYQPPKTEPRFFYGYIVVIAAFCIMVAIYGSRYSFGVFFKPVLMEFGWTRAMTSGAFSLSMAMQGLLCIVMGWLNDKLGPRVVVTLCGVLMGLGYLLMSQVSTIWQIYLFYGVLVGIGMSGVFVPLASTIARWFVKRRSMMTGIVMVGMGIGGFIGPPVASQLISAYEWRISYVIVGGLVLVVVTLVAQLLRRDPSQKGQVPYGENKEGKRGSKVSTEGFSLREAVYTRQFWQFFAMQFCTAFCGFAILVHIVPHATDLGISAATAANILATISGLSIVGLVLLGSAADRIGNRRVFIICFILMSAALFGLMPAKEVWMLYLFAGVLGLGYGSIAAVASPLVAQLFGLASHGLIYGFFGFGFSIGGAVGPLLTGYIFDITGSYQTAFLVCAAIGIVGLISTAILRPTKRP